MAGNITVAIVIILIIGGIIFGCWVDRADTKIADRKNEAASDKQTADKKQILIRGIAEKHYLYSIQLIVISVNMHTI